MAKNVRFVNENRIHMKEEFPGIRLNIANEESEEDIIEVDKKGLSREEELICIKK